MKKLTMLLFLAAMAVSALADDYAYLSFADTDGSVQSFTAQGTEITFSGGNAIVTSGSASATIALSSLAGMSFSNDAGTVALQQLSTQTSDTYEVWSVSGVFVGRFTSRDALQQLTHGIYVVRNNGKTQKMILP